jgi:hypothetical protein
MEGQKDDNSQKFRLRVKAEAMPNEHIILAARLATGQGSARSTNVTMGNTGTPNPIWMDQVYMTYKPIKWLSATGGKFAVPMRYTDMVFDPDLNLEGTDINLNTKYVFAHVGGYWIAHNTMRPDLSQAVFMYQAGFTVPYCEPAVGYYDYSHQFTDYKILDANLSIPIKFITIYGNYVRNTAMKKDNDGYLAGLKTKFKFVNVDYNYRDRKPYSVYTPFTDDDWAGGYVDAKGHRINLWAEPYANTKAGVIYMMTTLDPTCTKTKYNRLMVDFEVAF